MPICKFIPFHIGICLLYGVYPRYFLSPSQSTRLIFGADRWDGASDLNPTSDFIKQKLSDVLHGRNVDSSQPPAIDLLCKHSMKVIIFPEGSLLLQLSVF
jgi:hypothetical protein